MSPKLATLSSLYEYHYLDKAVTEFHLDVWALMHCVSLDSATKLWNLSKATEITARYFITNGSIFNHSCYSLITLWMSSQGLVLYNLFRLSPKKTRETERKKGNADEAVCFWPNPTLKRKAPRWNSIWAGLFRFYFKSQNVRDVNVMKLQYLCWQPVLVFSSCIFLYRSLIYNGVQTKQIRRNCLGLAKAVVAELEHQSRGL